MPAPLSAHEYIMQAHGFGYFPAAKIGSLTDFPCPPRVPLLVTFPAIPFLEWVWGIWLLISQGLSRIEAKLKEDGKIASASLCLYCMPLGLATLI
jgi:hypothetical protein